VLRQVTINGFRSFINPVVVDLPSEPGLYLMRGVNHVDARLDGNDVGKSTFWDAILWGLYGETSRGLRASNVVSWGKRSSTVEQCWDVNGRAITIARRQNPNGLWINGQQAEQRDVVEAINYGLVEFLHCVLVGQFTPYFLDLSPTDKLNLFNDILGLVYWEGLSAEAAVRARQCDNEAQLLCNQLERATGRLDTLRDALSTASLRSDEWQQEHDSIVANNKRELDCLAGKIDAANEQLRRDEAASSAASDVYDSILAKKSTLNREVHLLTGKIEELRNHAAEDVCPWCKRALTHSWREKAESELVSLLTEREQNETSVNSLCADLDNALTSEKQLRRAIQKTTTDLAAWCALRDRLHGQYVDMERNVNPHAESIDGLRHDLIVCAAERRKKREAHNIMLESASRNKVWVSGFKDLRLWLVDTALAELAMRTNNSMVQLGLHDWSLSMAVEREKASGGVSRGLHVSVRSPGTTGDVPWRTWGGGVTQRLRVAAEVGLSRLIADRRSVDLGIEVWDEADCHLSPSGVDDLLLYLQSRAADEHRQIWVVTHQALDFPFDGVCTVRKGADGSLVELE
jgi:DNA repair exonuclease SbcCD ATPase subunit